MTSYEMTTTSSSGTNIRPDHNTNNVALNTAGNGIPAGVILKSTNRFVAPVQLKTATGVIYQHTGDVWLETTYGGFTGWVAYIHKGETVCNNFKVVDTAPPPVPPVVVYLFPEYYDQVAPDGTKVRYFKEA